MGVCPGDFRDMTPLEFNEVQEAFLESRGELSARKRNAALSDLARLKAEFPDMPAAGHA